MSQKDNQKGSGPSSPNAGDPLYALLLEYLRAGIEYLAPAEEHSSNAVEIATIVAALERRDEKLQHILSESDAPDSTQSGESDRSSASKQQSKRIRVLESRIEDAEKIIRSRDEMIEELQVRLLIYQDENIERPQQSDGGSRQFANKKIESFLANLEKSRKEIETQLKNSKGLNKFRVAQLKSGLARLQRKKDEITALMEK